MFEYEVQTKMRLFEEIIQNYLRNTKNIERKNGMMNFDTLSFAQFWQYQ